MFQFRLIPIGHCQTSHGKLHMSTADTQINLKILISFILTNFQKSDSAKNFETKSTSFLPQISMISNKSDQ